MDMTGLAQKGGAVVSHIQIANQRDAIHTTKISLGAADVMLACDLVVAAIPDNLGRLSKSGFVIANSHETATGEFTRNPEARVPVGVLTRSLTDAVSEGHAAFCDATDLAEKLVGDAVGVNLFLVGMAWQRGLLPLSLQSIERAIALNGVAVELNMMAFTWGRISAIDPTAVQQTTACGKPDRERVSVTVEEVVQRRVDFLKGYQSSAYAAKYAAVMHKVVAVEAEKMLGRTELSRTIADSLFRLMAYKDEYEVARLHTEFGFFEELEQRFEGPLKLHFHLAPPLISRRNPGDGLPKKQRFGAWMYPILRLLARGRILRGTVFDAFGYTRERRLERQLIANFNALILEQVLPMLNARNYDEAVELAALAQSIKGYGYIKEKNRQQAMREEGPLIEKFRNAGSVESTGISSSPELSESR